MTAKLKRARRGPRQWHKSLLGAIVEAILLGLFVAAVFAWWLGLMVFGALPGTAIPAAAATATNMTWLEPVKVALTIAAGIGAAVALVVAYRKQHLAERQELAGAYAAAAAQLGHGSPTVRLAGAYSLATLADSWPEQRQRCVDVLCAHLRLPWNPVSDPDHPLASKTIEISSDTTKTVYAYPGDHGEVELRKTILRIIGAHLLPDDKRPTAVPSWAALSLDFTASTLPDIDWTGCIIPSRNVFNATTFSGDATFFGSTFSGDAMFFGSTFNGHADFRHTTFSGSAIFHRATFSGRISFQNAIFSELGAFNEAEFGGQTWFDHATFHKSAVFDKATFNGITYFSSVKANGDALFTNATFSEGVGFDGAKFNGDAWFMHATFTEDAFFLHATFNDLAAFDSVTFNKLIQFSWAKFNSLARFNKAKFNTATCPDEAGMRDATFIVMQPELEEVSWANAPA